MTTSKKQEGKFPEGNELESSKTDDIFHLSFYSEKMVDEKMMQIARVFGADVDRSMLY